MRSAGKAWDTIGQTRQGRKETGEKEAGGGSEIIMGYMYYVCS